ncbi:thiol reductant ABC exporter subunit CydC [Gordonia caeni]|uniref:Thiol reductant ABC exporter subunit CydC n=1 Tax=Gordonia caeni TaxID=1007097 RepID=A0ABP7NZ23_9ACTN
MSRDPMLAALRFTGLGARPVLVSVFFGAAGALSALGLAALSAWLITRAWQMPPVLYLSVAVTAVRALGISRALFRYLERLATHDAALRAMATARTRIYRALAGGAPAYSVGLRQSALLARTADDVDDIGDALIRGLIPMAVGAVTAVAAVAVMAMVSPLAAVILAIALLVSGVVAPWLAARGSTLVLDRSARAREDVADAATALLWHGPELAVAGRRREVLGDLRAADRRLAKAVDTGAAWQVTAGSATPLALGVSVVAAALIAVDLASRVSGSLADVSSEDTRFTPMLFGILVLLPLSSFEMTGPLTEAGIAWERGRQAARRVLGLVAGSGASGAEDGTDDPVIDPAPAALATRDLQWGWERPLGPPPGLDLRLEPGERLVIVGPSGCGKSTLLLTMAGLLPPLAGRVQAEHGDGAQVPLRAAACYFAEEAHLFSTSVRENLLVARGDATDDQILAALDDVGLAAWVAGLPDGLDTDLAGGGAALSGGQRRRLLLARALLHPAPIVLLDEPAEHLDIEDARAMMERICSAGPEALFGPERLVVVVTHQHAVAAGAAGARLLSLGD